MEIISPWMLYFWTRLDILTGPLFIVPAVLVLFVSCLCWIAVLTNGTGDWTDYDGELTDSGKKGKESVTKAAKTALIVAIVLFLPVILLPSKKDMAVIYVIPEIVNNEGIQTSLMDTSDEFKELYKMAKTALKAELPTVVKDEED